MGFRQQQAPRGMDAIEELLGLPGQATRVGAGEEGVHRAAPAQPAQGHQQDGDDEDEGQVVPVSVMKDRLARQGRKFQAAEEENKALKARLEALEKKLSPDLQTRLRQAIGEEDGGDESASPEERMVTKIGKIIEEAMTSRFSEYDRKLEEMQFFGELTVDQRDAVTAVRERHPSLSDPQELLALARIHDPIAFDEEPGHGGQNVQNRPGRGARATRRAEEPQDLGEVIERASQLPPGDPRRGNLGLLAVKHMLQQQGIQPR